MRSRLGPADVGLPQTARRRGPGLRRQEVAQLAPVRILSPGQIDQSTPVHPLSARARTVTRACGGGDGPIRPSGRAVRTASATSDKPAGYPSSVAKAAIQTSGAFQLMVSSFVDQERMSST